MKTVVVTGASRGIGKAVAEKFLKEGFFVIGTSTAGTSEIKNDNFKIFSLDLTDSKSISDCVEKITALHKKIDILVNNAGIWSGVENDPIVHVDLLRKTLEVNLIGTIDFTEKILPLIEKGGHIINVSSRAGSLERTYHTNYPDYKISKAALNMYTRVLGMRLEKDAITVSSVHPGWVRTDMGGEEADIEPQEAADDIYELAISKPESGKFWFKNNEFPW